MTINRRDLLKTGATLVSCAVIPRALWAEEATFAPDPGKWREFEVTTRLEITHADGKVQAWIPVPSVNEPDWCKSIWSHWSTNGDAALRHNPRFDAGFIHAQWDNPARAPTIEVTSLIRTQDRAVDLERPTNPPPLSEADRARFSAAALLIPSAGIVKETSDRIVGHAGTDLEKATKIYEWVVDNTARNSSTRGCGIGDIAAMLESGNLTGKCADINALYVGLARAAGLPARDLYGIRVAPSRFGYKSLGTGSSTITKAQHCRAEVYLTGFGWVPVDPADVRKVILEEPPANLTLADPKVMAARRMLFGAWEGNWLAYNFAHDLALPGASGPPVDFLMYPQAETASGRLDCLDPDTFKYTITATEMKA